MYPDVSYPNGCVRNIRHTQILKCLIKRCFDLLGPHQANTYNKRREEIYKSLWELYISILHTRVRDFYYYVIRGETLLKALLMEKRC